MINKTIDKENEINPEDISNNIFFMKLFTKKIIPNLLKYYEKYKIETIKFFNLFIGFIKQNKSKAELKEIIQSINKKCLKNKK